MLQILNKSIDFNLIICYINNVRKNKGDKTMENLKQYLQTSINNWYKVVSEDEGIQGKFLNAEIIGDELKITWEEMGTKLELNIFNCPDYTKEIFYDIWMEEGQVA